MSEEISIRLALLSDIKNVFNLSNDLTVRKNSINEEMIEWEHHTEWFSHKINDESSLFYVAYKGREFVGYCRLDWRADRDWVVTIHIRAGMRGLGYGSKLLRFVCEKNINKDIHSLVKKGNLTSALLFKTCGFSENGYVIINGVEYQQFLRKPKFIFIGHFLSALKIICKYVKPVVVIVENKPCALDVIEFCKGKKILVKKVSSSEEVNEMANDIGHIDMTIVASFGLILKSRFIKKNRFIINFHPGDLPYCRGRHPLPCAIKHSHDFMGVAAHLIEDEKIDAGPICCKILVPINYDKDYKYNENILLGFLPLLVDKIMVDFIDTGNVESSCVQEDGVYYPPLPFIELKAIMNANNLRKYKNEKNHN